MIAVAMVVDYVIAVVSGHLGFTVHASAFFGLLVAVWYLLNELLSIMKTLAEWALRCLNGC